MRKSLILWLVMVVCAMASSSSAMAQSAGGTGSTPSQSSASQESRLVKLEQQVVDAKSSADNAWMLTCSALVLMMTGPGLALFYGGLVRKKNVLRHNDAEFRPDGVGHCALGTCRL